MRIRVIGVGNRFRRDDGAGVVVAELVREFVSNSDADLDVRVLSGEGASVIEALADADLVFIVDAARSLGSPAGSVVYLDPRRTRIPSDYLSYSSHAFSVAEAVEMARALGLLPPLLRVVAITAEDFGSGEGLTPAVAVATKQVARHISDASKRLLAFAHRVRIHGARAL